MKRHGFEPAALVTGLVLLMLATAFALDAADVWDLPPRGAVALAAAGLSLPAVTAAVTRAVRGRRHRAAGRRRDDHPYASWDV